MIRFICFVWALALPASVWGQADAVVVRPSSSTLASATFSRPARLGSVEGAQPVWTREGVALRSPVELLGPIAPEDRGIPVYDAETDAWYSTAQGCLVRLSADGTLPVVLEGMQALDVDVRPARGLAVSRESDAGDRIVLHRWGKTTLGVTRRVLLEGPQFFHPRLSPDGTRVLVAESRAEGGHMWLVGLDGAAQDLGQGYGAAWHPDGRRIVFTRIEHDGFEILASEVLLLDLSTRKEVLVARTQEIGLVALEPAVSPDGKSVAFTDPRREAVYVAALPQEVR